MDTSLPLPSPPSPSCKENDVTTLLVRHILAKAIDEFGRTEIIQGIIDHMLIPIGKKILPYLVCISVIVLFILIATIATMVMALSCLFKLRKGGGGACG